VESNQISLSGIGTQQNSLEKSHGIQLISNTCMVLRWMMLNSMVNHLISVKDSHKDVYWLSILELHLCLSHQQPSKLWLKLESLSQIMLRNAIKLKIMVLWISLWVAKLILYLTKNGCSKSNQWIKNLSFKAENNKLCSKHKTFLVHKS